MTNNEIFLKIINSNDPAQELLNLDNKEKLRELLPELTALKGVDHYQGQRHKDNFKHTIQVVRQTIQVTDNPWMIAVAILHDIGKASTKRFNKEIGWTFHNHELVGSKMIPTIFERLKLPIENLSYVQKMVEFHGHIKFITIPNVTESAIRRFITDINDNKILQDLLLFCKCDTTTKLESKRIAYTKNIDVLYQKILSVIESDRIRLLTPSVSGDDIMTYFKLKPGMKVGLIRTQLKNEIINGSLVNERDIVFKRMIEIGSEILK